MRIALTVKGAGLGAWLDDDFAHCGHVMIVDENYRFSSWENPDKNDDSDLAANLINRIISEKVDFFVTGRISSSHKKSLEETGLKVVDNKTGAVLSLLDEIETM